MPKESKPKLSSLIPLELQDLLYERARLKRRKEAAQANPKEINNSVSSKIKKLALVSLAAGSTMTPALEGFANVAAEKAHDTPSLEQLVSNQGVDRGGIKAGLSKSNLKAKFETRELTNGENSKNIPDIVKSEVTQAKAMIKEQGITEQEAFVFVALQSPSAQKTIKIKLDLGQKTDRDIYETAIQNIQQTQQSTTKNVETYQSPAPTIQNSPQSTIHSMSIINQLPNHNIPEEIRIVSGKCEIQEDIKQSKIYGTQVVDTLQIIRKKYEIDFNCLEKAVQASNKTAKEKAQHSSQIQAERNVKLAEIDAYIAEKKLRNSKNIASPSLSPSPTPLSPVDLPLPQLIPPSPVSLQPFGLSFPPRSNSELVIELGLGALAIGAVGLGVKKFGRSNKENPTTRTQLSTLPTTTESIPNVENPTVWRPSPPKPPPFIHGYDFVDQSTPIQSPSDPKLTEAKLEGQNAISQVTKSILAKVIESITSPLIKIKQWNENRKETLLEKKRLNQNKDREAQIEKQRLAALAQEEARKAQEIAEANRKAQVAQDKIDIEVKKEAIRLAKIEENRLAAIAQEEARKAETIAKTIREAKEAQDKIDKEAKEATDREAKIENEKQEAQDQIIAYNELLFAGLGEDINPLTKQPHPIELLKLEHKEKVLHYFNNPELINPVNIMKLTRNDIEAMLLITDDSERLVRNCSIYRKSATVALAKLIKIQNKINLDKLPNYARLGKLHDSHYTNSLDCLFLGPDMLVLNEKYEEKTDSERASSQINYLRFTSQIHVIGILKSTGLPDNKVQERHFYKPELKQPISYRENYNQLTILKERLADEAGLSPKDLQIALESIEEIQKYYGDILKINQFRTRLYHEFKTRDDINDKVDIDLEGLALHNKTNYLYLVPKFVDDFVDDLKTKTRYNRDSLEEDFDKNKRYNRNPFEEMTPGHYGLIKSYATEFFQLYFESKDLPKEYEKQDFEKQLVIFKKLRDLYEYEYEFQDPNIDKPKVEIHNLNQIVSALYNITHFSTLTVDQHHYAISRNEYDEEYLRLGNLSFQIRTSARKKYQFKYKISDVFPGFLEGYDKAWFDYAILRNSFRYIERIQKNKPDSWQSKQAKEDLAESLKDPEYQYRPARKQISDPIASLPSEIDPNIINVDVI